uniref:CCHC-type domain-containing protein n=1 Tax=Solanum lycopersicum TaxID=4081 RepID=A0A3Q7EXY1_SOLLC
MAPSMEWMKLVDETYLVGMQNFLDFAFKKQESVVVAKEEGGHGEGDAAKGRDNRSKTIPPKDETTGTNAYRIKTKAATQESYENCRKGAPHREGCYICGETTHAARYCPSLRKLSVMVAAEKQQEKAAMQTRGSVAEQRGQNSGMDKGKNVIVGMFNHMDLFNHISIAALAAQSASIKPRESLFVDAKLNGKDVRIMLDTGATHNFVTEQKAKELGLNYVASNTMLKTINATPTFVHGFAPKVSIDLGDWSGLIDFTIVPMDVFDYEVNAFISPHHNQLHISDTGDSCVVPLIRVPQNGIHLLAMQIIKGFKRGEPTFLVALVGGIESCSEAVPLHHCIEQVLSEIRTCWRKSFPNGHGEEQVSNSLDYDLFDRLGQAKVFMKMVLRKVRITEGDKPKTTCVTRYGAFQWLVMPFGLTNAPATFCTLMNKLFHQYLHQFVVIYLDDIVVYSDIMEDHVEQLRKVFKVLRYNDLCVKWEKCSFAQPTVQFLGHTISHGEIRMDGDKLLRIRRLQRRYPNYGPSLALPIIIDALFFSYSAIATRLTDLLSKNREWERSDACQAAFDRFKADITEEPILALPDFTKAFELLLMFLDNPQ